MPDLHDHERFGRCEVRRSLIPVSKSLREVTQMEEPGNSTRTQSRHNWVDGDSDEIVESEHDHDPRISIPFLQKPGWDKSEPPSHLQIEG